MAAPVTAPLLVRNEEELLDAIRARLIEVNITYETLDCVAVLPERYSSKLLCRPPIKHAGALTLWNILGTLGFEISLVATDVPQHLRDRMTAREQAPQSAGSKPRIYFNLTHRFMRKIGRLGGQRSGEARRARASAKQAVSEMKRRAALKRWHKPEISEG
jgi:hypothetical protein